jgi:hypothetical protein
VTLAETVGAGVAVAVEERTGVGATVGVALGVVVGATVTAGVTEGVGAAEAAGEVDGAGVSAAWAGSAVSATAKAETAIAEFRAKRDARLWGSIRPSSPMIR